MGLARRLSRFGRRDFSEDAETRAVRSDPEPAAGGAIAEHKTKRETFDLSSDHTTQKKAWDS